MEPSWWARDAAQSRPARALVWTTLVVGVATVALPFTRLGPAFGLVPLSPTVLAAMGGITAAYLAATEAAKRWFFATAQGGSR